MTILSIYTVDKFRKFEEWKLEEYQLSMSNLKRKSSHLQSAYLQALTFKDIWLSEGIKRNHSIRFDTDDIDLFLRLGPEDKLDSVIIFIESHVPEIELSEYTKVFNHYHRVNNYLCINFDPTTSDNCKIVTKKKLREYTEVVCYG